VSAPFFLVSRCLAQSLLAISSTSCGRKSSPVSSFSPNRPMMTVPVGGAILIRAKSPASWLMRDAVVANFKLVDQDRSSNRRHARAAHGFVVRTTPECLRRINLLLLNSAQRAGHQAGRAFASVPHTLSLRRTCSAKSAMLWLIWQRIRLVRQQRS